MHAYVFSGNCQVTSNFTNQKNSISRSLNFLVLFGRTRHNLMLFYLVLLGQPYEKRGKVRQPFTDIPTTLWKQTSTTVGSYGFGTW